MSGADYFTYSTLVAGELARAADVNTRMAALQTAFGRLPHYDKIRQGRVTYVQDSGPANALVVSLDAAPSSYVAGLDLTVKVLTTNSGASTINVNGLGAKAIKSRAGAALIAGELTAGAVVEMVYDGTDFRLTGATDAAITASAAAAAASATAASTSATAASTSATAAAASATAAATSATNAATSATNAANSATAAAASATAAATSEANVAAALSLYALKSGTTFTGAVTILAPASPMHPATKQYVDDAVFAAGAYTADGTSITLSAGQFSLTTIADQRIMGNVSGGVAKPIALTQAQARTFLGLATVATSGSAADLSGNLAVARLNAGTDASGTTFWRGDGVWATPSAGAGTVTAVTVATANGVSATVANQGTTPALTVSLGAITPSSVAASGTVTGSNLSGTNTGDQTNIAGNAATATQLNNARTIAISGAVTGTATSFNGTANITIPITALNVGDATTGTLAVARGGTGVTTSTGSGANVLGTAPTLSNPVVGTQAAGDNSTKAASTAFVQTELADYCNKFATIVSSSADFTLSDATHHNALINTTGATIRTITANSTPTAGFYCTIANTGTAARTFSCAGGVYIDGATATTTSASIPAGGRVTAIHKGAGVWFLMGV